MASAGRLSIKDSTSSVKCLGLIPRRVKSGTVSPAARHSCDVFSKLCCPSAKPGRWALPLVTGLDVIPRV